MSPLVPIAMFGWIPVVLGLFCVLTPRRAVIAAFILGWLFLPIASYKVPGITAYTKMTATSGVIALAVIIFDIKRLIRFRISWVDLPMAAWCFCPFCSSISNGLGAYDGISAVIYQTLTWGLPYLIGRLYFTDLEGLKELATGIFLGGLIYVPFCLIEIRMSPQLHHWIYGFSQHSFAQTIRFGGYRPMVFMEHGLMVGMWMTAGSLLGIWLWWCGALKHIGGIPAAWLLGILLVTTVACKSAGALVLLMVGIVMLAIIQRTGRSWPLLILIALPPMYVISRADQLWTGENLVHLVDTYVSSERAESLEFRLLNENLLSEKALEQPTFGWGGWGRARVQNDNGKDITVTDSMWIISMGNNGIVGLMALMLSLLLPSLRVWWMMPGKLWTQANIAPAAAMATLLVLYMIDCLLNGMMNPIFILALGGLAGLKLTSRQSAPLTTTRTSQAMPMISSRYRAATVVR